MPKNLQISAQQDADLPLSKEQKRFNSYVRKIQELREKIETTKEQDLRLRKMGEAEIAPAEKAAMDASYQLVESLDSSPHVRNLSERQREKFNDIMVEQISTLLETTHYSDHGHLKKLYEKYDPAGQSWDKINEENDEEVKKAASFMFSQMFGIDLDAEDLDNPEKAREKLMEHAAKMEAEEKAREEKKKSRKKTPKQIAAEEKRKNAQETLAKTTKQIYHEMIRHFHPDKEQDEQKKLEKTEVMKQITAAYDADDYLKLLELQMTLLASTENAYANFDDNQLKYFNTVLKKQVDELEMELGFSLPHMSGNLYAMLYHEMPFVMELNVKEYVREQKMHLTAVENTLKEIQTSKGLKNFVKDYKLSNDFDFINFDDFFR